MFKRISSAVNRGARRQPIVDSKLSFETLEDRRLLATFTVTSLSDTGAGSLREVITTANGNAEADTITFSVSGTIDINSQLPTISDAVTITGPGADLLTIDAGSTTTPLMGDGFRIFEVDDGTSSLIDVSISGLTLTGADVPNSPTSGSSAGGAFLNRENLTIDATAIVENRARFGGGISTTAGSTVTISNSLIANNDASQNGGGVSNSGNFVATNVTISGNNAGGGGGIISATNPSPAPNATLSLSNSTVTGNTATDAPGVHVFNSYGPSQLTFENTIIDGPVTGIGGASTLSGNNNLFSGADPGITGTNNQFSTNPLLGPLANNGGPTQTHALLPGSPALDAGSTIANGSFEDAGGSFANWSPINNVVLSTAEAIDGSNSAQVGGHPAGFSVLFQGLAVEAGSEVIARVQALVDTPLPAGQSGELKIEFYNVFGGDINNASQFISQVAVPTANSSTPAGSWNLVENIATAPAGAVEARIVLTYVGTTTTSSIFYDDVNVFGAGGTPQFDQRGTPFLRDDGSGIDIGAYEATPLSLVVGTTADISNGDYSPGDVSLREAIELANLSPKADLILFSPLFDTSQTIALASQLPTITDDLTITGPGQDLLTLDAGNGADKTLGTGDGYRLLEIDDGTAGEIVVAISGLTLTGGDGPAFSGEGGLSAGGAIFNAEQLTLTDTTISHNAAANGGGITNEGTLDLHRSTIVENRGRNGAGGGINNRSMASISSSLIANNIGSGIQNGPDATLSLIASTLSGNASRVTFGGGLRNVGTATIISSTITNNRNDTGAGGTGAGIDTLFANASLTIVNSIVAGNDGTNISGSFTGSSNLIGGDAMLGPLAFNGGPTKTHALLPGSPAIDAGTTTNFATAGTATQTSTFDSRFVAGNAIDGDPATTTATASADVSPSWQVELINEQLVAQIVLHNRDALTERLRDITVEVLDGDSNVVFTSALLNPNNVDNGPATIPVTLNTPVLGKTVRVSRTTTGSNDDSRILSLAEVEIFGVDQRGLPRGVDLPGVANAAGSNGADIGAFEQQAIEPIGTPPVVTSFTRDTGGVLERPDLLSTISVSFDMEVNVSPDDLIIRNETLGGVEVENSDLTVSYNSGNNTAEWDFSSLVLDPGFYSFELSIDIVSTVGNLSVDGDANGNPGGAYIEEIYVAIPGDLNLDGDVDISQIVFGPGGVQNVGDASILLANLTTASGATYYDGDLNGDGDVDVTQISIGPGGVTNVGDASILLSNLGLSVVPPIADSATFMASTATISPPEPDRLIRQPSIAADELPNPADARHDASLAVVEMPELASSIDLVDEYFADSERWYEPAETESTEIGLDDLWVLLE